MLPLGDGKVNKFNLLAAVAAIALPLGAASAQTAAGVKTTTPAPKATTPAATAPAAKDTLGTVSDTVDQATDTAADAATPSASAGAAAQGAAPAAAVVAATPADVKAGVAVLDTSGGVVGKIESVSAQGAVIATGKSRVQVPLTSFAKNDKGLVISLSKAQLDAEAAAKSPS
jgi:septal ring-binding cell division protein DamX